MKIARDEIEQGLVIYIDQKMLIDNPNVEESLPQKYGTTRPFICYKVLGDRSWWAPLTGQHRPERLEIKGEWRSGGLPGWTSTDNYLNDGANTYSGPSSAFVVASHAERTTPSNRARISAEGVEAVLAEIARQRHRQAGTGAA